MKLRDFRKGDKILGAKVTLAKKGAEGEVIVKTDGEVSICGPGDKEFEGTPGPVTFSVTFDVDTATDFRNEWEPRPSSVMPQLASKAWDRLAELINEAHHQALEARGR